MRKKCLDYTMCEYHCFVIYVYCKHEIKLIPQNSLLVIRHVFFSHLIYVLNPYPYSDIVREIRLLLQLFITMLGVGAHSILNYDKLCIYG